MVATQAKIDQKVDAIVTGKRFVIWNPRRDPTTEAAPQRSTDVRPFVFPYVDATMFALTPVTPGGGVVPTFKTLTLLPGLNEVDCTAWASAIEAAKQQGQVRPQIRAEHTPAERLALSSQNGLDPIQQQILAGAIVVPTLNTDAPSGTIGDYNSDAVAQIVATVKDALTLQSWLTGIAQGAIVHAEKGRVERILKDAIAVIEGQR